MVDLARTVGFYEALAKTPLDQDIDIPDAGLHVVAVGPFLILALDRSKLGEERFLQATQTHTTILTADVECAVANVIAAGATIVQPRFEVSHGSGYRIRHPDGLLVEYLQHRPSEYDVDVPSGIVSSRGGREKRD
jgi:predicted enzyme related to lactoylglutathione lyase